ncbi:MAG: HD domain-containing protein [Nitrososphaerota archaeon]|jgi:HD superfamily phosphohydrolase|nr:HD domain-containing protein [Nitrososphaerota archaeon]
MPQFRDPIHGFITISEDEQKIVDSAPFQRLRNIRQLATTYLIYHGSEHTRFGHSIGVMHLVTRTFDSVVSKSKKLFRDDPKENVAVIKWYRQILRLIALTHDLGYAPFSHAAEELFPTNFRHEDYTKKIIEETEIAKHIKEIGEKLQKKLANKLQVSPDELSKKYKIQAITPQLIWMIYGKKPSIDKDEYLWPDFLFLKEFMDGELDCDKMDYLLRDSLYCGVTYGKYDLDRFVSTLRAHKNKNNNSISLAISSGGVQAFEEFVLDRYFMFIQVYFHKTRRYLDRLLVKCLKDILPKVNTLKMSMSILSGMTFGL